MPAELVPAEAARENPFYASPLASGGLRATLGTSWLGDLHVVFSHCARLQLSSFIKILGVLNCSPRWPAVMTSF